MKSRRTEKQKFFLINQRKPTWQIALRIALIYLSIGLAWILLSDIFIMDYITNPIIQSRIHIIKGLVYVCISAIVIYFLIAPTLAKQSDNEQVIRENQNELKAMLYYDHLTGLSNRRKLVEHLPGFLNTAAKKEKALIFIDIDNIKLINDTLGHRFGDEFIAETARRVGSILMSPDEMYRLGGDEFLILTQYETVEDLRAKIRGMLILFESPLSVEKTLIHSTISIGISLYPMHSTSPEELLKFADMAMYRSKQTGKNRAIFYDPTMMAEINERMSIGEQLHDALKNNELEVFYQPQITTATHMVAGFEALIRWNNTKLGRVPPDKFISVAEETHLIIPIGQWILRESCKFLKRLQNQGFVDVSMSVNISMIQLIQEDFVPSVLGIIAETKIDPKKLELEITESVLMESYLVIREHLDALRAQGIGIALDDFGKGYSSLSYLEQLPITTLKIDKLFIDRIDDGTADTSIAGNIVNIGKKFGLSVLAEGVETKTQLDYLSGHNCDRIQGWIFSKALPMNEAEQYIDNHSDTGSHKD